MLNPTQLMQAAQRVAAAGMRPATVIVSGSCARGDVNGACDLDSVAPGPP